jgi:hypothetical protein
VGNALRDSELRLDGFTLARLRAARRRAVEAAGRRGAGLRWALVPVAVAAALAVWLLLPRAAVTPGAPPVNAASADTLDLLTDERGPAFYQNLDLYRWLEDGEDPRA